MKLPVTFRNSNTMRFTLIVTVCGLRLAEVRVFVGKLFVCSEEEAACSQVTDGAFCHPTPPSGGVKPPSGKWFAAAGKLAGTVPHLLGLRSWSQSITRLGCSVHLY